MRPTYQLSTDSDESIAMLKNKKTKKTKKLLNSPFTSKWDGFHEKDIFVSLRNEL